MPQQTQNYSPTLSSREMSQAISALGIRKANTEGWQLLLLGLLSGTYIGIGAHLYMVALQSGLNRVWASSVFSVGLVLVVVAGAELFTGNVIMIVGTLTRRFSLARMLRSWVAVYIGNFLGAYLLAILIWRSGLLGWAPQPTAVGAMLADVAAAKLNIPFGEAFIRGVLCNALVILAILMAILSRDVVSKVVCCVLPVTAFVASGFEHCVANMYLIPAGLFAQGTPWGEHLAMCRNLIPVTLGNIVGGVAILVLHPNRIRQFVALTRGEVAPPPA